ncbi:MAG: type II toxin-antitoxin system prevent-host-death family antitoxin [Phycisphaeraceae bacterium]|nr:type II toxin-antitoxin system prevent-host-death family antitoxin [Phycisphaeraceae bacterium]
MESVDVTEASQRLDELIDAAVRGERVVLTRGGKPVAELIAIAESPVVRKPCAPMPSLAAFRASIKIHGKPMSETVIDERRSARY